MSRQLFVPSRWDVIVDAHGMLNSFCPERYIGHIISGASRLKFFPIHRIRPRLDDVVRLCPLSNANENTNSKIQSNIRSRLDDARRARAVPLSPLMSSLTQALSWAVGTVCAFNKQQLAQWVHSTSNSSLYREGLCRQSVGDSEWWAIGGDYVSCHSWQGAVSQKAVEIQQVGKCMLLSFIFRLLLKGHWCSQWSHILRFFWQLLAMI